MRKVLLGLLMSVLTIGSAALAANNDVIEFGLTGRYMLDGDTYGADNSGVDYASDTYPLAGDFQMNFGVNLALGHRFDSRKGPFEVLFKYNLTTSMNDVDNYLYVDQYDTVSRLENDGSIRLHEFFGVVRFPSSLVPVDFLQSDNLYYDLGLGVATLVYEYDQATWSNVAFVNSQPHTITRSGLAFNVGVGYRLPLTETLSLNARVEASFSQIQDIENSDGDLVHKSPDTNNVGVSIGVTKYFHSLF